MFAEVHKKRLQRKIYINYISHKADPVFFLTVTHSNDRLVRDDENRGWGGGGEGRRLGKAFITSMFTSVMAWLKFYAWCKPHN